MDRRFLTVLGVSLIFALVVSSIFYQMTVRAGSSKAQPENTATKDVVVATRALAVGVTVKTGDVKVNKVPPEQFPKGAFVKVEEVIDRPVVSNILAEEPILDGRLAARGSGMGLSPMIPVGMRAVAVRVNDVAGVSGFVLPGMRVDVLVTGRPSTGNQDTVTTTVLQNILVLSAGQTIQPDARGQAINAPTVTLLVSPDQAETLTLSNNEGRIQLVLRNGADQAIERTTGHRVGELYSGKSSSKPGRDGDEPVRTRTRVAAPSPPPPPPVVAPKPALPPPPDEVIVIRGTQKSVEVVSNKGNNQ
jgi:pilus assembly protein CpaB